MNNLKTWAAAALVAALFTAVITAPASASTAPVEVITSAIDELKQGLQGNRERFEASDEALYEFIDSLLLPRFDRAYAGRLVLARHWRGASNEQKRRFIDAFYQTLMQRYASGVLEFREDRVEVLADRSDVRGNRATVRTQVTLDDGETVPVNYGLVERNGEWKVYDVTIEGISYVRNFRAELDTEISKEGLEAVISRLEQESSRDAAAAGEGDAAAGEGASAGG